MTRTCTTEDRGATAVEYALMVALVFLVIITAVTALGVNVIDLFSDPTLNSAIA